MAEYMGEDVVREILRWLPAEAILRWRCVSKSWKELIDSTHFRAQHLVSQSQQTTHHLNSKRLIMESGDLLPISTGGDLNAKKLKNLTIVSSSSAHGVVCLYDQIKELHLWNPSTRQSLRIPLPLPEFGIQFKVRVFDGDSDASETCDKFAYDEIQRCGFWIDPSTNDFKIVLLCFEDDVNQAVLYSSTTPDSWIKITMDVPLDNNFEIIGDYEANYLGPQLLIDGVAHWISVDPIDILFFDFRQHKFGIIVLPKHLREDYDYQINLCKWQDDLLSFVRWQVVSPYTCEVWTLKNESWDKMLSFSLAAETILQLQVVGVDPTAEDVAIADELVIYDPNRDGCIPQNDTLRRHGVSFATDFVETLVFPC